MVISGGNFKPDTLKPKEVVSLLLDDEEIEQKCENKCNIKRFIDNYFKYFDNCSIKISIKFHFRSSEK